MSDSPLFPWQVADDQPPLTQEIKDPLSPLRIVLPKYEGLLVNEVLFAQWAVENYTFMSNLLSSEPSVVRELVDFCHKFLCLRLGLADWVKDDLSFVDASITAEQSLSIPLPNGQKKSAPLYLLYMIYGFFTEEQSAWLGKSSRMMEIIQNALTTEEQTGANSTGESNDSTQTTPDLQGETSDDAQSTSSKPPLKVPKKPN